MPKYLYCAECNCGLELEKNLKTCGCGNVRGKYRADGETADVCAKIPEEAYFIGIRFCLENIVVEILAQRSKVNREITEESRRVNTELTSAIRESEEWKQFDRHKSEFKAISNYEDWRLWIEGHEADGQEKWDFILRNKGYAVGTVISIEKFDWHRNWKYSDLMCRKV